MGGHKANVFLMAVHNDIILTGTVYRCKHITAAPTARLSLTRTQDKITFLSVSDKNRTGHIEKSRFKNLRGHPFTTYTNHIKYLCSYTVFIKYIQSLGTTIINYK